MPRLSLQKAGLLSPKTLRNEIVENVSQMDDIQTGGRYASANSIFPAVDLDAPSEAYFVMGDAAGPMNHVAAGSEAPLGTLGSIGEKDITTKTYKKKRAPDKRVDAQLNSNRQIISLYKWAASQLRKELFLTREQVAWRGTNVTDGLIGIEGETAHPSIPTEHVLTSYTPFSDHQASKPYDALATAAYLLAQTDQHFMESPGGMPEPTLYYSPSFMRDLKLNQNMADKFTGVEVRGLTGDQVRSLVDSEIPNLREVRVNVPRTDKEGNWLNEDGSQYDAENAEPGDSPAMDNVLEPYDPDTGKQRRNAVVGMGGQSAFIPFFTGNVGDFDDPGAPQAATGFSVDSNRGFMTHTWYEHNTDETYLEAIQDIGFHVQLPEWYVILQDV